jgi:hypothetical protein
MHPQLVLDGRQLGGSSSKPRLLEHDEQLAQEQRGAHVVHPELDSAKSSAPSDDDFGMLVTAFAARGGVVEAPPNRRFIVVTVPVAAGFEAVEAAMRSWVANRDCPWAHGNVYDGDGQPLCWRVNRSGT